MKRLCIYVYQSYNGNTNLVKSSANNIFVIIFLGIVKRKKTVKPQSAKLNTSELKYCHLIN